MTSPESDEHPTAPAAGPDGPQTVGDGGVPDGPQTVREAFSQLARRSGIGQVDPGEIPTARSLLTAIGGVRGLVEAILPGLAFLLLYSLTSDLTISVLIPVGVALIFVAARLIARTPATQAFAGVAGVAVSAALALFTGRPEDNFLPGIITNAVSFTVVVVSIIARYPLIGLIVGILSNEGLAWRDDPAKRRMLTLASWLWATLFATRLLAQVPLYLTQQVEALGVVKLVLGVPFYAAMLWVTWLLVQAVYGRSRAAGSPASE